MGAGRVKPTGDPRPRRRAEASFERGASTRGRGAAIEHRANPGVAEGPR
jgi:hypothetical protein